VVSETRGGVESDYVSDPLGSTIGLMNSAGTMTDRWEYWPFGEIVSHTGTNPTPLTFLGVIGYFQDVLSKLYYVRARLLRVDIARWLTADPTWPGQPAYVYAANTPTSIVDPSGLDVCADQLNIDMAVYIGQDANCVNKAGFILAAALILCAIVCASTAVSTVGASCAVCFAAAFIVFYLMLRYCFDTFCLLRLKVYKKYCGCQKEMSCTQCMSGWLALRQCKDYFHEVGIQYPVTDCTV
jgi:RHS repeat-associated protein